MPFHCLKQSTGDRYSALPFLANLLRRLRMPDLVFLLPYELILCAFSPAVPNQHVEINAALLLRVELILNSPSHVLVPLPYLDRFLAQDLLGGYRTLGSGFLELGVDHAVVEVAIFERIAHRSGVKDLLYSSPISRCGTHRAALRATIKRATLELEAADLLTGLADSFHFTVPSRVVFSDHAIGAFGEYVAVLVNDYGAENPARFLYQRSFGREFNRPLHEFLILLCHRISPFLGFTCLTADAKIRHPDQRLAGFDSMLPLAGY